MTYRLSDGSVLEERFEYLAEALFETLGTASVCWETPAGAGVFDSTKAGEIGTALLEKVRNAVMAAEIRDIDLVERAWGIIANAHEGGWDEATPQWREAAEKWRDQYHAVLAIYVASRGGDLVEQPTQDPSR